MIYNFVILSFRWSHEALILVISHTYSHSYEPVMIEELASRFDADWPQFQKLHLKDDIIVSTDQICGGVVVRTCELQVTDLRRWLWSPWRIRGRAEVLQYCRGVYNIFSFTVMVSYKGLRRRMHELLSSVDDYSGRSGHFPFLKVIT